MRSRVTLATVPKALLRVAVAYHEGVPSRLYTSPTAAVVVYQGVLVDETEVFRFVLSYIPGIQTITVGTTRGTVAGPGGVETAEMTLVDVGNPAIVAVPGGIGSERRPEIANWLQTVSPAWILASSTGSVLLATAGLLNDSTAATHWLADSQLERHGAHASREQLVVEGRIVTCSGAASAFRAALVVAEAYGGPELVQQIRDDIAGNDVPELPARQAFWHRLWNGIRRPRQELEDTRPSRPRALDGAEALDLGMVTLQPRGDRTDRQ